MPVTVHNLAYSKPQPKARSVSLCMSWRYRQVSGQSWVLAALANVVRLLFLQKTKSSEHLYQHDKNDLFPTAWRQWKTHMKLKITYYAKSMSCPFVQLLLLISLQS